jgi:hypothetical protein
MQDSSSSLRAQYTLRMILLVLSLTTVLVSGCKTTPPKGLSGASAQTPAPGATIIPTALPILKQKLISKAPLNLNDQVALRSMPPQDRQKLMAEVQQAK